MDIGITLKPPHIYIYIYIFVSTAATHETDSKKTTPNVQN
jgi:hypothetical protein